MTDQHTHLHLANLQEFARKELIQANVALALAELAFRNDPTPENALAQIQAEEVYQAALANKRAVEENLNVQ